MSEKSSVSMIDQLLRQLQDQKDQLEREKKRVRMVGISLIYGIAVILTCFALLSIIEQSNVMPRVPPMVFIAVVGMLIFTTILISQFDSLRREIQSIISGMEDKNNLFNPSNRARQTNERDLIILNKVYDGHKNTIDKLFEKLKTFSNTWLVVAGGIASTLIIEIFKSGEIDIFSGVSLVACSSLLWSIAQHLYGMLNYELVSKTKELAQWYVNNTRLN